MQIYGLLSMKLGTLAENNIYDKAVNDSFTATWRLHKSTKQQAKFNFKCSEKQEKHHLAMGLCLTHWGAYSAVRTQPHSWILRDRQWQGRRRTKDKERKTLIDVSTTCQSETLDAPV